MRVCVCVRVCCINQLEVGCSTKLWFTIYRCLYLAHPLSLPLLQSVLCSSPHTHTHTHTVTHCRQSYGCSIPHDHMQHVVYQILSISGHWLALPFLARVSSPVFSPPHLSLCIFLSLSVCAYRCDVDVDVTLCCTYATAAASSPRTAACCMRVSLAPLPLSLSLFRSLSVALCGVEKVKRRNLCLSP